ncbi:ATP-binding protein [Undibacterium flavidum]|uniref:ATP-grasp domain-containing protein n=1 Tax=Undibacterium flavidum TaxID=2762297 RepID=A0ABR6YHP5_9BURK|nr:hypothetical protein [Undibacterium flavidum]MBC3876022.1 hypothetical protein [Undibacterium flavidum]
MNAKTEIRGKQRSKLIETNFQIPAVLDFTLSDQWLTSFLDIEIDQLQANIAHIVEANAESNTDSNSDSNTAPQAWLARILLCTQQLLQLCRLPAFDSPAIMRYAPINPERTKWQALVALPLVEHIPTKLYQMSISAAIETCNKFTRTEFNDENARLIFGRLRESFITPLRMQLKVGKSSFPVLRKAYARDIPFMHLSTGIYQLGWGSRARRLDRSSTDQDSAIGARLSHSKTAIAQILLSAGLPAANHLKIKRQQELADACRHLGWPLVIKPNDREGGVGVSVNIHDDASALRAFELAQQQSQSGEILVEKQVNGVCHRLFILGDQLLYAVKRWPISVKGDGVKTVHELIEQAQADQQNSPVWNAPPFPSLDAIALESIQNAGYQPDSILEFNCIVPLRPIESTEWGGIDEDVSLSIHPENTRIAILAARLFGLEVAGVDIISADITQPWYSNQAILNEINYSPLLGGGEISLRHIDTYLDYLLQDNGRIPVCLFVGDLHAHKAAQECWQQYLSEGFRAYFADAEQTLDPAGNLMYMPLHSASERAMALCYNPIVDAIVIVLSRDEYVAGRAPLGAFVSVQFIDD